MTRDDCAVDSTRRGLVTSLSYQAEASNLQLTAAEALASDSPEMLDRYSALQSRLYLCGGPGQEPLADAAQRELWAMCRQNPGFLTVPPLVLEIQAAIRALQHGECEVMRRALERAEARSLELDSELHWHVQRFRALARIDAGLWAEGVRDLLALHARASERVISSATLLCRFDPVVVLERPATEWTHGWEVPLWRPRMRARSVFLLVVDVGEPLIELPLGLVLHHSVALLKLANQLILLAAREVAQDSPSDRGEQLGYGVVARRWRAMKAKCFTRRFSEDAVEHQDVEVEVQVACRSESLQKCDCAGPAIGSRVLGRAPPVEAEDGPHHDAKHGEATRVVRGESVAQPLRDAEHDSATQVGMQRALSTLRGRIRRAREVELVECRCSGSATTAPPHEKAGRVPFRVRG